MRSLILVCFILAALSIRAQESHTIIPYPNKLVKQEGRFEFKSELSVTVPYEFKRESDLMSEIFAEEYYIRLTPSREERIIFRMNPNLKNEGYTIEVKEEEVIAEASTPTGCFWAFQTLRQLMTLHADGAYTIACCRIEDQPAFPWRGIMLDVVRTFRQKAAIKTLLDEMALLKMNVFHWHLTDDQGWRIEIDKYPKLTEVGAWRDTSAVLPYPLTGWASTVWDNIPPPEYADKPTGGYYTKDDIREIVNYASRRHITIIPEIEMPGHSSAAIAAYPWLGANDSVKKVPKKNRLGALNVADENVCRFMEDVLKEAMELFPGKIIHIGGDEVKPKAWEDNESIKTYMEKNGLKNYNDLQMKFINRIGDFIAGRGFRMMGWNEIYGKNVGHGEYTMEDSGFTLNKQAIVHFWKGSPDLLKEVAENGYDLVYSDNRFTYTTFSYKSIPLSKAYRSSPVPEGMNPEYIKHVLGIECPMWTENSIRTTGFYPYVFPRIAAYAEVGWTVESHKDYERFTGSLWKLKKHWDEKGILYSDSID